MVETVTRPIIRIGSDTRSIEDIVSLASGSARAELAASDDYRQHLNSGVALLEASCEAGHTVYGVNTGFGDSCQTAVPEDQQSSLPVNLFRYHGCGTGEHFSYMEGRAIVACRLVSLAKGYSGVRPILLESMVALLNAGLAPSIPKEGSVGASGDLTPLSYIAAVLSGEREVLVDGKMRAAGEALQDRGLRPIELAPKESLALMNGTSVMAALNCFAFLHARRLARFAATLTAMAVDALEGRLEHFDARIHELKPHLGQVRFAQWVRSDLSRRTTPPSSHRIQDQYSLRCAPHIGGVLLDSLPWMRTFIQTELNSVNDNPIVDPDTGNIYHGGNFYGGHMCYVADCLKNIVANLADMFDRQFQLLCNPSTNRGLPANLVGGATLAMAAHHGFKAMGISTSALAAEALKQTIPASVFSRSTENHNQDKVSMGTIATRECLRIIELTETVAAIHLLGLCQALDLRGIDKCCSRSSRMHAAVRRAVPSHVSDRRMDVDIAAVLDMLRNDQLPLGSLEDLS
ncbi:MAG: aromatic amino acid lyase [Myxococcales bacterium]|nr:aromatic amino acid lyase [Myxococcales bacterium]MCB9708880.1 aromatic amino acid lyase [Myxococcales bacterium]